MFAKKFSNTIDFALRGMHKEILTKEQVELLPLVKSFSNDFGLVDGTAIALHLGHRKSIDFDLFTYDEFDNLKIRQKILKFKKITKVFQDEYGQYTISANNAKLTFLHYPYKINFSKNFDNVINLPDLLTLASMKAFALGRRAKWKDYVDLYFIIKNFHSIEKIVKKSKQIFSQEFNEKLFRSQLAYFKDIDYTEEIDYIKGFAVEDKIVKKELIDFSLN